MLLAGIHQKQELCDVEAVVPNVSGAETMVEMINKHVVAYLSHYLENEGMPVTFVTALLKASLSNDAIDETDMALTELASQTQVTMRPPWG